MSTGPNPRWRALLLGVLVVGGGLALAFVAELAGSPLRAALRGLPLEVATAVVLALLAIAVGFSIGYERLSRDSVDEPADSAGETSAGGRRRASKSLAWWLPSRRTLSRATALVTLLGVGVGAAAVGPRLYAWLNDSVMALFAPPWSSESLYTFQRPFQTGDEGFPRVSFSLDDSKLAISGYTRTIQVWDLETGGRNVLRVGELPQDIAVSPDGGRLVLVGNTGGIRIPGDVNCGGKIELWNLKTGRLVEEWHRPAVLLDVAFSPDGEHFAVGGGDCERREGLAELWDQARGQRVQRLTHGAVVTEVAFGEGGGILAAAGEQRDSNAYEYHWSTRLWNVEQGRIEATVEHPANVPIREFALDPSGNMAISAGSYMKSPNHENSENVSSDSVLVWDTQGRRITGSADSENRPIDALALSPDGNTVAVARHRYRENSPGPAFVEILRVGTLERIERFEVERGPVESMAFDDSGRRLAVATDEGVELWTRRGG